MQNSKPQFDKASRTGWDSGGFKSEKRVLVKALFGSETSVGAITSLPVRSGFFPDPKIVLEVELLFLLITFTPFNSGQNTDSSFTFVALPLNSKWKKKKIRYKIEINILNSKFNEIKIFIYNN